jgi:DNA-binding response OmpR family regulator
MINIAIVEDSEDESDQYRELLEAAWDDVTVDQLFNEDQARAMFDRKLAAGESYDLITLDIDLSGGDPGIDKDGGFRLLSEMSNDLRSTVIVVSGRTLSSEVEGFMRALKVVDTLAKPHSPADYLRAVRLGLQLQSKSPSKPLLDGMTAEFGTLRLSPLTGKSTWSGQEIKCTLTQMRLLVILAENTPNHVPIGKLKKALPTLNPTTEAVAVHIAELRKEFRRLAKDEASVPIKTRPGGGGYCWNED